MGEAGSCAPLVVVVSLETAITAKIQDGHGESKHTINSHELTAENQDNDHGE